MATGYGLDDEILGAYKFLAEEYEDGDAIYLFGFSRGSYTVRALAAFIHMVGLLHPDQANISDYALTSDKQSGVRKQFPVRLEFQPHYRRTADHRQIHRRLGHGRFLDRAAVGPPLPHLAAKITVHRHEFQR